jgi:hypothetical protein
LIILSWQPFENATKAIGLKGIGLKAAELKVVGLKVIWTETDEIELA